MSSLIPRIRDFLDHAEETFMAVALAFMKERGCVVTRYRRNYPASDVLFEDAMIEFCAFSAAA